MRTARAPMGALDRWEALIELISGTYVATIVLDEAQTEAELAKVAHAPTLLDRAARIADDLSRRFTAARSEGRDVVSRREVSDLLFLPMLRANRSVDERWAPVVYMGAGGEAVFAAIPLLRREAAVIERVPLRAGAYGIGLANALAVLHLVPSPVAVGHVLNSIERIERAVPAAAKGFRDQLSRVAAASPEVAKVLATLR